ncbi:MAG: SDR family NAD(P)-dependent oxidoreductase [Cyanothece sp. SIO2G6]|nr:SDR family NAD(P)-dependent oxidoreductase [Cyanothece sp. SIO2G6]
MTSMSENDQQIDYQKLLLDALTEMRQMRLELETLDQEKQQLAGQLRDALQLDANHSSPVAEPIAIVGMDCRFPGGANSPEAYWSLLRDGVDAMAEVPSDRWNLDEFYDPDPDIPGKMYTRVGGFIDGIDQFDPEFFGISPREAISLDPQQRLLLEVSHTALERAGQSPEQLRGSKTGVFVGLGFDDYASRSTRSGNPERIDAFTSLGNTRSIAVGRISYVLGLQGPTLQLDTTCSSSLLAVHLACQSLRAGEASMALAGGVSAMLSPEPTIGFCKLKALAADGRCKTFDASANGYGRGEGCGMVVLKRYEDAVVNGDRILGIIRGSAVNHDGQSNGLTAPNGSAQVDVIRQAIANANVLPSQIQYVEAHGTGTSLGDPIELIALGKVLGAGRSPDQPLRVGSVKTNIGHLEASAGVAGLIKVILTLQHRQIPPHLHFQQPNPYIPWERLPVEVPTTLLPFHQVNEENEPLLAGISSFGMSGTNVHMVVEAPSDFAHQPPEGLSSSHNPAHILVLSAKTPDTLMVLARSYGTYLQAYPNTSLDDLCFTAATGRSHYDYRLAIIATSIEECCQLLTAFSNDGRTGDQFTQIFHGQIDLSLASEAVAIESVNASNRQAALITLAKAYIKGQSIDWDLIYPVLPIATAHGQNRFTPPTLPPRQRLTLPTYPFQRQRYWMEQPQPLARFPHSSSLHPLLGNQLQLATVDTIHFESVLQRDHLPLIKHHRIFETAILPAAAYLEMAIAAAQSIDAKQDWLINDIVIHTAMVFGDPQSNNAQVGDSDHIAQKKSSERTVQLALSPTDNGNYSFKILSQLGTYSSGAWQHHAEGKLRKAEGRRQKSKIQNPKSKIQNAANDALRLSPNTSYPLSAHVEAPLPHSPTPPLSNSQISSKNLKSKIQNLKSVGVASYYQAYREVGIDYGPSLQVIEQLWQGEGNAFGSTMLSSSGDATRTAIAQLSLPKSQFDQRYYLHPILLDAGLQVIGAALPDTVQGLYLPVSIESFQILNPIEGNAGVGGDQEKVRLWACVDCRVEERIADIQWLSLEEEVIAVLTGVRLQPVSARQLLEQISSPALKTQGSIKDWFYQVNWQPQPHRSELLQGLPDLTVVGDRLKAHASDQLQTSELSVYGQALPCLEQLSLAYVVQALQELGWNQSDAQSSLSVTTLNVQPKYQRLLERLLSCVRRSRELKEFRTFNPELLQKELQEQFPIAETELSLLADCGSNLAAVMRGEVDPLHLLFPNGDTTRITRLYQDSPGPRLMNELVQDAMVQIANTYPAHRSLRILEIGGGTGGTTAHLLPHLQNRAIEYTFTDVSSLFLTNAQERFEQYPFIDYRLLDIEQAPDSQDFPSHHWDVVIAANVLHATEDIQTTLSHVHQLLAVGGRLILLEGTESTLWLDLIFGLTDGWWRFDDAFRNYPLMDQETWHHCLTESGFENCQFIAPSLPHANGIAQQTVMLAQAGEKEQGESRLGDKDNLGKQHWLIWSDRQGVGETIVQQIEATSHHSCSLIEDADEATVATHLINPHAQCHGIIYLATLDMPLPQQMDSEQLHTISANLCTDLLTLVQTLAKEGWEQVPQLWLVTQDAVHVGSASSDDAVSGVAQSLVWGMGKAIALEYPELRCRCVDLDASVVPEAQAESLWHEIHQTEIEQANGPLENQIALRHGTRYVSRLCKISLDAAAISTLTPAIFSKHSLQKPRSETGDLVLSPHQREGRGEGPFRLAIAERGTIDNLYFEAIDRRVPDADEVEIRVQATGLNFRDVLNALDLYPGDPGLLGCECVGQVVAVGTQVNTNRERVLRVGDEVMAIAPGSFSQFITVNANLVVHRPQHLTVEESATIPVTFLTAYYALYHLGGLKAEGREQGKRQKAEGRRQKAEGRRQKTEDGRDPLSTTHSLLPTPHPSPSHSPTPLLPHSLPKTVLIHAASGGVGQAAIQLAHLAGARVFATSSPAKWDEVKRLGVERVANSRSLEFADEVMDWTDGDGVDLVLNSLSGEFIPKSLDCVKSGGNFIEIGKRDVWSSKRVAEAHADIAYTLVDMVDQCNREPGLIQEMFEAIATLFESRNLQPLPQMVFPIDHAPQAFRTMQQAQHIGKIVIRVDQVEADSRSVSAGENPTTHDADELGTFLITGGLGGLGLQFADWLVEQEVKYLALVSRRVPDTQQQQRIRLLEEKGADVHTYAADVADFEAMGRVMQDIEQSMPRLQGIIHGAGVLDDGVLQQQTWERFQRVLQPKVQGAWNLHRLTQASEHAQNLEHFILFSSATALLGSPGQANHVTANTFLDTLAHHRRGLGLPSSSINWGIWSDIGSAAERKADQTMAEMGIGAIAPTQGIQAFEHILAANPTQVGVLPVDWSQVFKNGIPSAFLSELTWKTSGGSTPSSPTRSFDASTASNFMDGLRGLPEGDRHAYLAAQICQQIAQVLGFKAESINPDKGFFDLGMDSLTSVELKNKLQAMLGYTLSPTVAFDYPTVNQLTEHILKAEGKRQKVEEKAEGRRQKAEVQNFPTPSLPYGQRPRACPPSPQNPKSKIQNSSDFSHLSDQELLDLLALELAQGGGV